MYPWSANVQWTFHMSIGHFKCPLDPMDHWTLYSFNISTMLFTVVTKSGLVHWIQLTLKYPMDIRHVQIGHAHVQWTFELSIGSNGQSYVQWTFHICPLDICVSIGHVWIRA
jgi:hypothetical protein